MPKITKLRNKKGQTIYPISVTKAIYMKDNTTTLDKELEDMKLKSVKYKEDSESFIYFNGETWERAKINAGSGSSSLDKELTVAGVTVGNLTPGTTFPVGTTTVEILEKMLIKVIPPTYTKPTVSLLSSIVSGETGQEISPTLTVRFTKNDGGEALTCVIKDKNTKISEEYSITLPSFVLVEDKNYSTTITYGDGPIKNNNVNTPDPIGQILAGSCSGSASIKSYRPFFGFASNSFDIPDSIFIRQQNKKGLNLNTGATIQVVTEPTSRMICFAYPATIKDCSKIRYEDLNDDNNKTAFTSAIVPIYDLGGNNPIDYRVYYYISPIEFGLRATFTLTV